MAGRNLYGRIGKTPFGYGLNVMADKDNTDLEGPQPRPGILDIKPYIGGASSVAGKDKVIKLSSNESALGPSPKAVAAFERAKAHLERYPDGGATALRDALADHYGLKADRIVCGAGSDELLTLLVLAYAGAGDEVLYTEHGFLVYKIATLAHGATPVAAAETNDKADVDALLAKVTDRTRILFLANPNNPTGTYLPVDEVKRLHAALPSRVLLVLDAAYAEFVRRNDYEAGIEMVSNHKNVVMTRTFSKIYGLAGLRLGWAYCPKEVAGVLNRIRGPFNVSAAAQQAGIAALQDARFTEKAVAHNEEWRSFLDSEIKALGLEVTPSVGNFLLVHFGEDQGQTADDADAFLKAQGIIVRKVDAYGYPNSLRVSVGQEDENKALVAALKDFVGR